MQSGEQVKQLGLIFMSEADANALMEKVTLPPTASTASVATLSICKYRPRHECMPQNKTRTALIARGCDMQVREQNPKLAKQSRVLKVSMDNVYDFAVTPEVDKKTAGVSFRFMPELKQVQKALEVRPRRTRRPERRLRPDHL